MRSKASCHPDRPLKAKGLCGTCYKKSRVAKQVPARCHQDRPEFVIGSGVCRACYDLQRRKVPATCHPSRPMKSKGLCDSCYQSLQLSTHVPATCHPDRPEFLFGSGVCKSCYNKKRQSNYKPSECHPDRPELVRGSGLCKTCYSRKYNSERPPSVCHPGRPMVEASGLCNACYSLKHKYGIVIDYTLHKCEICNEPLQRGAGKSAIDHNHETGSLRGILCGKCNMGLGLFKDSTEVLQSAIKYLIKYAAEIPEQKAG